MVIDTFFRITFLLGWLIFGGIRVHYARKSSFAEKSRSERLQAIREEGRVSAFLLLVMFWLYLAVAAMHILALDIIDWSYVSLPILLRYIGTILGIISISYVYWTHSTLRQNYSATLETSEGQQVVREGPYARVRHPIYSSHTLFNFGMVLV